MEISASSLYSFSALHRMGFKRTRIAEAREAGLQVIFFSNQGWVRGSDLIDFIAIQGRHLGPSERAKTGRRADSPALRSASKPTLEAQAAGTTTCT